VTSTVPPLPGVPVSEPAAPAALTVIWLTLGGTLKYCGNPWQLKIADTVGSAA
jgi:hypothetical protein